MSAWVAGFRGVLVGRVSLGAAAMTAGLTLAACAATSHFAPSEALQPIQDAPARFEPRDPAIRLSPGDTLAGSGCVSPLVDPRDGTELWLVRSARQLGDYAVSGGRYGAGDGFLVRVACNTGVPQGLARR